MLRPHIWHIFPVICSGIRISQAAPSLRHKDSILLSYPPCTPLDIQTFLGLLGDLTATFLNLTLGASRCSTYLQAEVAPACVTNLDFWRINPLNVSRFICLCGMYGIVVCRTDRVICSCHYRQGWSVLGDDYRCRWGIHGALTIFAFEGSQFEPQQLLGSWASRQLT